tara:strand:+ start:206 stop:1060 length:855 start_codon:yes stop_codon:yes gene_type:complete
MNNSEVSIYVPVYNGQNTIELCINSILSQTVKPNKILVVNDNSTDQTAEILKKYSDKIEIISNKENSGVSYIRNLAVNYLKSKFIASIDADVELTNDWLEKLIDKANKENTTLIGGRMYEKFLKNPYNLWRSIRLKQNWGEKDIHNPKFVFGCNNLLNTENLDKQDMYRNDLEYYKTNGEDIEFSKKILNQDMNLYYCSSAICYHLQDDNQKTLSKRYWRYIHYGDGLKKRNLYKTFKNIFRQFKKTLKWSIEDLIKLRFKLIKVNFLIFYNFAIIDYQFFKNK